MIRPTLLAVICLLTSVASSQAQSYVRAENDAAVARLQTSTNLHGIESVSIDMNGLSADGLSDLAKLANSSCTNLHLLSVHGPLDSPLQNKLLDFTNLNRLFFYYTSGAWSGDVLANLKATNVLFCMTTNLFPNDVRSLLKNPNLRRVTIQHCREITSIDTAELDASRLDTFILLNNRGRTEWNRHKPPTD